MTKITDIIILNPFDGYKKVYATISAIFKGNLPTNDKLIMIDGTLLAFTLGALTFASSNGISVINNLREH